MGSEASGRARAGEPVDFYAPIRPLVINLLQISQEGNLMLSPTLMHRLLIPHVGFAECRNATRMEVYLPFLQKSC